MKKRERRRQHNSTLPAPEKPLSRTTRLKQGKALSKKNAKRTAKRRASGEVYGSYHAWMGELPCCLKHKDGHRCVGKVVGHHLKSVGAGGRDRANEVPACVQAHDEMHWSEDKVEARYRIDLHALAKRLYALWLQQKQMAA